MKGQSKRFVDHFGKAYDEKKPVKKIIDEDVGFFDLWRYATWGEVAATGAAAATAWGASAALVLAVALYGELTALFVARHRAAATTQHARVLRLFGGGAQLAAGNRSLHMDALVDDSIAFAYASAATMALQLSTAALAVTLANWAAARMTTRLRWKLLRAVISQEMAFFDTNTTLNFASTLTEDMEKLRAGVGEHVAMTSYLAGSVALGAAAALLHGWQLTLVGLAVVPVAVLVAATVAKYQTRCSEEEVEAYGAAARVVEEALHGIRTVRAFGGEHLEVQRYGAALAAAAAPARRRGLWAGAGAGLGWLLTYALNAVVFAYGAALCVRDMDLPPDEQEYHPGVMVTVLFCTFMAAQNIAMCHPHLEVFSSARGAAKSLFRLLQRESKINALEDVGVKPDQFRGDIEFDNVYFNYPSRPDVKVLRGLTLTIKAGETVALVGASGCGKSTVLQLLQRLYDPCSGHVRVDSHRLSDLHLHHYRTHIGVVGQEPVLFSGTVRDNVSRGASGVADARLHAAARLADAHEFIMKLPDGYDTALGAGGAALSGGQKQRLAIARAVLERPAVLLLDEPTSALDPAAERSVQAALDAAARGRTTVVVSHRLSTIVNASRIVYMEHGAALEQGTHQELLDKKGLYWRLVQQDMTQQSIASTLTSHAEEGGDVTADVRRDGLLAPHSPARASLARGGALRGSRRLASVSSVSSALTAALPSHTEPEEAEDPAPPVSTWQLLRLNAEEWPLLAGGGVASFLIGATMPAFALLFSKLYGMFAWSDKEAILAQSQMYAAMFAGVAALCGAVTFLQAWLLNLAGIKLTDRLRVMTFTNFLRQEQGWFDRAENAAGALCARLATDCAHVQGATGTRLGTVLQGVSTMAIGIGLALPYSWQMTLVSLLSVPCVIGGIYLEGAVTRRTAERERAALEHASRLASEAVCRVRTVQALGIEESILGRYTAALAGAARRAGAAARVRGPVYGVCLCAPTLGYAVSLAYGGYLIARRDLDYEYAILVSEALIYGAWMLAEALSFAPNFAAARRSGARIVHALAKEPSIVSPPGIEDDPSWSAAGVVNYSNVHFRYPTRAGAEVLRGLSLRLEAGRTVALVGASGCGKSTLMHLLMRSYDPDAGTVELDGRDTRAVPLGGLRARLGLVQQEPALFARSLRDNIAYGDNSRAVSLDEVVRAAKQADVHAFIASLPLGYDTCLGAGAALSGGQRQRVAVARALLRDPRVLLLDEATSALDAASEQTVQAALEKAAAGRTTVVIAHRLATVRHAHVICVIHQGVVAESGSHEELVQKKGLYWELLQQQAGTQS